MKHFVLPLFWVLIWTNSECNQLAYSKKWKRKKKAQGNPVVALKKFGEVITILAPAETLKTIEKNGNVLRNRIFGSKPFLRHKM